MKFKNIFAGILASVALASTMLGATTASAATSKRISNVLWNGQEKNYWCGYAALTSAINNEYKNKNLKTNYNYSWSQSNVADYMQDYYNMHPYDNINYDGSLA